MFCSLISRPEVRIEEQRLEYLVDCFNEAGQANALRGDGWNPTGAGSLTIRPTIRKLTWREIFQWIDEELQISQNLRPSYPPTAHVNAIDGPPNARQKFPNKRNNDREGNSSRSGPPRRPNRSETGYESDEKLPSREKCRQDPRAQK